MTRPSTFAYPQLSSGYLLEGRAVSSRNHFEDRGRFLRAVELAKHGLQLPFPPAELTDQANLLLPHGRGLRIIQALMDEVGLEENGTVVRMRKWLRRHVEQA